MSKQKQEQVEIPAAIEAPSQFVEKMSSEKPEVFTATMKAYQRLTRNAGRQANPITYLTLQGSYAYRIFSALPEQGNKTLFVKSDNNGRWAKIENASRATFRSDYNKVIDALHAAAKNGVKVVAVEVANQGTPKEQVKIKAVGGVVGI